MKNTIVLNEKEYAETCLKNKVVGDKPFFTLSILAKYYYHHLGYRKKKISDLLVEFMANNYPRYSCNKLKWNETIEKISTNAGKFPLHEINGVWVTESELETISTIHNKVLERLAFTLLCLAKLNNLRNPKNNCWVNMDAKDVFTLARIDCNVIGRYERLGQLSQLGLLEFPKKNDNLSNRVTYVSDDGEKILFISDFRELGYEYQKYIGDNFIRCQECGILVRNNKNGTKKYCRSCAGYTPVRTKVMICCDCGEEFEIDARLSNKFRCDCCQSKHRRTYQREFMRRKSYDSEI